MRRFLFATLFAMLVASNVGCLLPAYSGDPATRNRELLNSSEDLRQFLDEWERFWFLDQPSHMTPYRTHGGVI